MNIKKLADIHGLTIEEFSEIVKIFMNTAKEDIEKIRSAAGTGDTLSAGQAAHSLKGAAGNLGFKQLSEMAQAAEMNAKNDDLEKIASSLPSLSEQLEDIAAQFEAGIKKCSFVC